MQFLSKFSVLGFCLFSKQPSQTRITFNWAPLCFWGCCFEIIAIAETVGLPREEMDGSEERIEGQYRDETTRLKAWEANLL